VYRKNIEGCKRETKVYKGKHIKIRADFSTETLKQEKHVVRSSEHFMKRASTLGYSTQQKYHSK
jgi:hypothetical protein